MVQQDAEKFRQRRSRIAQRLNVRDGVRVASSLVAALLDEIFEHPAGHSPIAPDERTIEVPSCHKSFSAACWVSERMGSDSFTHRPGLLFLSGQDP